MSTDTPTTPADQIRADALRWAAKVCDGLVYAPDCAGTLRRQAEMVQRGELREQMDAADRYWRTLRETD